MINFFYRCEINNSMMKADPNADITMVTFISRPFMTQQAIQESIIKDFTERLKVFKHKIDVTSIKEVSPFRTYEPDVLEKKFADDPKFVEYAETWQGPEGPDLRFTFVEGDHYNAETETLDIDVPPKEFLACYNVSSFEDNFTYPLSFYAENSLTSAIQ